MHLPQLAHFELDSAYQGLVAVAGLPALLAGAARRLPNLASLSLNGLSLVPLSSGGAAPGLRRSLSSRRSPTRSANARFGLLRQRRRHSNESASRQMMLDSAKCTVEEPKAAQ